jgi:hypothetical protein
VLYGVGKRDPRAGLIGRLNKEPSSVLCGFVLEDFGKREMI